MFRFSKYLFVIAILIIAVYVFSYSIFSFRGVYKKGNTAGGGEIACWYPMAIINQKQLKYGKSFDQFSYYGYAYLPLVLLDRWCIHTTETLFSMQGDGHQIAAISKNGKEIEFIK